MVWQPGHKIQGGKYVIEKELGEGGFGITYQAQHTLLNQLMVIKTINESLRNDPEYPKYVKRFIEEGRKLEKLSEKKHPNIVRVRDLFTEGETYCLVMDFVAGESLFKLVQRRGALPAATAVKYIQQIGQALIVVHQAGLVHRDAHPGNIMVQKDGKAVLIDFGIAGEIFPDEGYVNSKRFASNFAPYEQMNKGGNRQPTIDVYTLAASLYYAVTGQHPETSFDCKLYNKSLTPPHKYVPDINEKLNWAILKGMKLEAKDRPQSMEKFLELLDNFNIAEVAKSRKIEPQNREEANSGVRTTPVVPKIPSHQQKSILDNIPWGRLSGVILAYSAMGFFSAPWAWAWAWAWVLSVAWTVAGAGAGAEAFVWAMALAWAVALAWAGAGAGAFVWAMALAWAVALAVALALALEKLQKSFSEWHIFLILLGTSWLGLGLGWLVYQIFPIIGHR
ncbi:serine/threonine protein kinase [Cylindrospermum sp. NIES-4074]|nr:serine/threonine protein kinase [Cylindrospermum sp. NIES-4074]